MSVVSRAWRKTVDEYDWVSARAQAVQRIRDTRNLRGLIAAFADAMLLSVLWHMAGKPSDDEELPV